MLKQFCVGLIFLFSTANGFDSVNFVNENCEVFSSELVCSYIKFSAKVQDEIQGKQFIISNATYVRFENCDIVANGAFFEKFPNARQFDFVNCHVDLVTNTRRPVSTHTNLEYMNIRASKVKNGYGSIGNNGLRTLQNLRGVTFLVTTFSNGISSGFFQQVPQIKEISLLNCELYSYSSESFRGLIELQSLQIYGSSFFGLNVNFFQDLNKLQHLYLDSNGIEQLPTMLLPQNLETLSLRNNSLRFITGNTFKQQTLLKYLYLSENEIEHVSKKAFENLKNLKYLQLQNNKIKTFTATHLEGPKNLTLFDISNNEIPILDNEIFDALADLHYFNY